MRISDWSSDVCSSDLHTGLLLGRSHHLASDLALVGRGQNPNRRICLGDITMAPPCAPALSWLRFACSIPFVLSSSRRAGVQKFNGVAPLALAIVTLGRAQCRSRVWYYGLYQVVAVSLKK